MILVTGGNGQLGQELNAILTDSHLTDCSDLDISDFDQVHAFFKNHRYSSIVNCAAYTAVDKAESEIHKAFLVNETGPKNLAQIAFDYNIPLIHISTDYVFDGKSLSRPLLEDDPTHPLSVYGKSKLAGEVAIKSINPTAVIMRTSWLYSRFGNNFVKTMIRLGQERSRLNVVFDQIGCPTYAQDLARSIAHILPQIEKGTCQTYHYSNEGVVSWYDFAYFIFKMKGINSELCAIESCDYPTPAPRPQYTVMNKVKIKKAFNLKIPHWHESLERLLGDTSF